MSVSQLIAAAFNLSWSIFPDLHTDWVRASARISKYAPGKPLMTIVHKCGQLDILIRAIEADAVKIAEAQNESELMVFHHQVHLSELWIGTTYEICRVVKEAKTLESEEFVRLAHALRLIRVPLEKMQIAADSRLTEPLHLIAGQEGDPNARLYTYAKSDPNRRHIMPINMSQRGSVAWHVIDIEAENSYWLERQNIADAFLKIFS